MNHISKTTTPVRIILASLILVAASLSTGCASTSSVKAKPLKVEEQSMPDLSAYHKVTVLPFTVGAKIDRSVGHDFADNVAKRLRTDYGPLFDDVSRSDTAVGESGELVVTGRIDKYKKGSRIARAMLVGLGHASLKGELQLKDGATNQDLMTAPISKLWAWGGLLGASKGIENMVTESEAAVAATIAQSKGWQKED